MRVVVRRRYPGAEQLIGSPHVQRGRAMQGLAKLFDTLFYVFAKIVRTHVV